MSVTMTLVRLSRPMLFLERVWSANLEVVQPVSHIALFQSSQNKIGKNKFYGCTGSLVPGSQFQRLARGQAVLRRLAYGQTEVTLLVKMIFASR